MRKNKLSARPVVGRAFAIKKDLNQIACFFGYI